jgi:hypothetical protein
MGWMYEHQTITIPQRVVIVLTVMDMDKGKGKGREVFYHNQ